MKAKSIPSAYLLLVLGVLSLGFSAIFVRWADAPGTVTAFYRMAIGSLVMALPFLAGTRRGLWLAVLGGVFFGADLTLWTTGIMRSGATVPTLMANTAPLWVGFGSWLLFDERQPVGFWLGTLLALGGAAMVLGGDPEAGAVLESGGLLGLGAAVFYGGYYLVTQRARDAIGTLPYFWVSTTASAATLLGVNLVLGAALWGYPAFTWGLFLATGLFVQVAGWMVINYAQGHLPASLVSVTMLGQPVVTALIAWPFFGETLNGWQFVGGAAVLAGVYWVHRQRGASASAVFKESL